MPIGVNLLAWRAARDRRARRQVWLAMPAAAIVGLAIMLAAALVVREQREEQLGANQRTRQQIEALADQRAYAEQLQGTHARLARRMAAMDDLLAGRTAVYAQWLAVVAALPADVQLIRIERGVGRMVIEGLAPGPASISALVNALRDSPRLPDLRFERLGTTPARAKAGDRFRIAVRNARADSGAGAGKEAVGP